MNFSNLIRRLTEIAGAIMAAGVWLAANWWVLVVGAVIITVVIVIFQIQSCGERKDEKRIEQTKENIVIEKVESNSISNQIVNQQGNVNVMANNANQAVNNAEKAKNANVKNVNLSEAERLRCLAYPSDCK